VFRYPFIKLNYWAMRGLGIAMNRQRTSSNVSPLDN